MTRSVATAVLLLAALGPALATLALPALGLAAEGGDFGVSEANPIGTRERLEAGLRAAGLAARPPEERRSEDMGGQFRVVAWVDEEASTRAGASEDVRLLLGLDGSLRGVTGSFTAPGGSEKVRTFLQRYWEQVSGAPPSFEARAPESDWMPASQSARFSAPGARGEWVKIGASESVRVRAREGRPPRRGP